MFRPADTETVVISLYDRQACCPSEALTSFDVSNNKFLGGIWALYFSIYLFYPHF